MAKIDYNTFKKLNAGIYSPERQMELLFQPDRQLELFGDNSQKINDYKLYVKGKTTAAQQRLAAKS